MPEPTQTATETTPGAAPESPAADDLLTEESLVEEVSIDGMCGVY